MTNEPLAVDELTPDDRPANRLFEILPWLALAALMLIAGYWLGLRQSSSPGEDSIETGFARDMMAHHAQAVDMATLVRDRTEDPDLSQFALDMLLTQQAQVGQMQGWLTVWEQPLARTGPSMVWMGMPTNGPMPGMASPEQLNQLRSLKGVEADILFLQLMIPHHQSGVEMAQAVLAKSQQPAVRALAQSVVDAQTSEINFMQSLLQQKGAEPVQVQQPSHNMESHSP